MVFIVVIYLIVSYSTTISGNHQNGNGGLLKNDSRWKSWDRERPVETSQLSNGGILETLSQRMQRRRQEHGNQWQHNRTNRLVNQNQRTSKDLASRQFQANRNKQGSNQPRILVNQGVQQRNRAAHGLNRDRVQSGNPAIGLLVQPGTGPQGRILANHIVQQRSNNLQRPERQRNNQAANYLTNGSWFSRHNGNTRITGRIQFMGSRYPNLPINRQ